MGKIEIIVVGASAGGVEAISSLVKLLPASLPASIFVVVHFPENATSVLPKILSRVGPIKAIGGEDNQPIEKGVIYVAPPGCHMLVKRGAIRIVRGPKENGHRPAIDPLFRSAARIYKSKVAGVILSGMLNDGVIGLTYVKANGGLSMVQDPDESLFGDLPRHAIHDVKIDFVAPISQLAQLLVEQVCDDCDDAPTDPPELEEQSLDPTEMTVEELRELEAHRKPSAYTCPECNGTLFELNENGILNYRCRVGHAYTPENLEAHQAEELEAALWEALKSLEENLALSKKLLQRAKDSNRKTSSKYYADKVNTSQRRIELLRSVLTQTISTSQSGNGPP